MKKSFIRKSFKNEMFLGLFLVAIIPGIVSSALLVNVFRSRLDSDYRKEATQQVNSITKTMEVYLRDIDSAMLAVIDNDKIVGSINETDSWEKNKAYTQLYATTEDIRSRARFDIYNNNGECVFSTASENYSSTMPTYWGILKVAFAHPDEMIIKKASLCDDKTIILQTARAIFRNDECLGFVVVDISNNDISTVLDKTYDESNGIAILDSFYEEIYSTKIGQEEELANLVRSRKINGEALKQDNDRIEFFYKEIGESGLSLFIGKTPVLTEDITQTMWGVIILVGVFSIMLSLLVATVSSGYLTSPIDDITKAMEKVKSGDLTAQINSDRQDELGQLSNQFDTMTKELNSYMELQVRQQKEINDSNIAMMQAQLNPHFLYNTLDTMKWVAKANQVPEIAKMSADLAQILRMSISDKKFITLGQEIELVEKYAEIQQIRFGGNFTFDVELPIELEDCIIPKLIIQPIVENAVIHGLREQDKGHIFANIYEKNGNLNIEVSDNGCGIDDEVIARLNSHDREQFRGHIGFYNVDNILKLYYGESYGLKAERIDAGGTMVRITLPINKEVIND